VVVVGGDKMSSIIDYEDRATCIIFGDGCGAVLLEPNTEGLGVMDSILRSDGSGCQYLHQKAGGSMRPATERTVERKDHYVYQEGKAVFKFAVTNMADVSAEIMEKNGLTADDVAWLVPHQANKRIIDATANRMGLDDSKVMVNIEKYRQHHQRHHTPVSLGVGIALEEGRQHHPERLRRRLHVGCHLAEMGLWQLIANDCKSLPSPTHSNFGPTAFFGLGPFDAAIFQPAYLGRPFGLSGRPHTKSNS
jgi:3-oxoacyl-(acyl-carrier-protein) synthase III